MTDFTRESWARDLLTRMGYPVTDHNLTSVQAWEIQEGGHFANGATFNPLNSTLGHGTYGSMNSVGVATYPDYETGMAQTIKTINLHYYDKIRADLKADADPSVTTADIKASPWGTWHGGASTAGALAQAKRAVAAHPATQAAPVTAPVAAPATVPTTAVAPASGTFVGADVDGLDKLATEFDQAAQVVTEVKTVCEAIVAAASIFGPFGAAFVAYLKGTVIPWLTKIASALQAMSKVLNQHSQAQKDASSTATSLPSYTATPPPATTGGDTAGGVLAAIERTAVAALLPGVGLVSLAAGAVLAGPTTPATKPAAEAKEGADGADLVPGLREDSKSIGYRVDKESLQDEVGKLTGEKESPFHVAVPIQHSGFDKALFERHGENWEVQLGEVKGGEAVFGGVDDKGRPQLGGGASIEANAVDAAVHKTVALPNGDTVAAENRTTIGAHATATAQVSLDPRTGSGAASYGVDAFAGAQNKTTIEYHGTWVSDRAEVTAQYGAGYANIGGVEFAPGEVKVHVAEGAAWGPGLKLGNTVELHYGQIVTDVGSYARSVLGLPAAPVVTPPKR